MSPEPNKPELAEYIKKAHEQNLSDESIREELMQIGWSRADVDEGLKYSTPTLDEEQRKNNTKFLLVICGLIILGLASWLYHPQLSFSTSNTNLQLLMNSPTNNAPAVDKSKQISLQQVTNVGYTFYLGQIDTPDAAPISDDAKNKITQILYSDTYPKKLLANTAIVLVNSLAVKQGEYVATPNGNLPVGDMNPEFLTGGGEYESYTDSHNNPVSFSLIFINKNLIGNTAGLDEALTHELGHHVASTLTNADWTKFYQLRGIASGTPQEVSSWAASPAEDFAEVYKNTVSGIAIRTIYGFLEPTLGTDYAGAAEPTCGPIYQKLYDDYTQQYQTANGCGGDNAYLNFSQCFMKSLTPDQMAQASAKADADASLQSCRRDVMDNPSKYPSDYAFGIPYKSTVGPQTKDFINTILGRLN